MANKKIGITGHNGFLGFHLKNQIRYKFKEFDSIKQAMKYANNSKTLVTGSFHTVCEAREYLKLKGYSEL